MNEKSSRHNVLVFKQQKLNIALGELLKSNGIKNYSITSGLHRKNAHKFYEHNGYEKGGYAFYKGLVILKKDE